MPDRNQTSNDEPPKSSVFLWIIWLLIAVVTPMCIMPAARGHSNGHQIGITIAGAGAVLLLFVSMCLGRRMGFTSKPSPSWAGMLIFLFGMALALGTFSVACGTEMHRALGH